ncbi:MAG: peptide-methionine (S)-S-oxide reductase [Nitratiruptor sp.]|nr:peptide-methionine (S)-S-oxide reductase [Nitratiruptor sp.]NPA83915.1 peptide-methionine (S)-S-oxide reductase MsrA [Campylobacterota bacterium]
MAKALFGGGCFWCLEAAFRRIRGVQEVTSGYAGCQEPNPTYERVCTGETGCAEAVLIEYDPQTISYQELLTLFFALHDPTQLNRQGADIGTQYRSVIFPLNPQQEQIAKAFIESLQPHFNGQIVTTIEEPGPFYPAEAYHQNYYERHPDQPYCQLVIAPKLAKLATNFQEYLR